MRSGLAGRTDIATAADAINHAVPTQQELDGALRILKSRGLLESQGKFYSLTPSGVTLFHNAQKNHATVSAVWKHLTTELA